MSNEDQPTEPSPAEVHMSQVRQVALATYPSMWGCGTLVKQMREAAEHEHRAAAAKKNRIVAPGVDRPSDEIDPDSLARALGFKLMIYAHVAAEGAMNACAYIEQNFAARMQQAAAQANGNARPALRVIDPSADGAAEGS